MALTACCTRAGNRLSSRHHSGEELVSLVVSPTKRPCTLFIRRPTRLLPTPARFLFLVVVATPTISPVDSIPEPSLSHWAPEPTGLTGGGGSLPLPAAAAEEKSKRHGTLMAYTAGQHTYDVQRGMGDMGRYDKACAARLPRFPTAGPFPWRITTGAHETSHGCTTSTTYA